MTDDWQYLEWTEHSSTLNWFQFVQEHIYPPTYLETWLHAKRVLPLIAGFTHYVLLPLLAVHLLGIDCIVTTLPYKIVYLDSKQPPYTVTLTYVLWCLCYLHIRVAMPITMVTGCLYVALELSGHSLSVGQLLGLISSKVVASHLTFYSPIICLGFDLTSLLFLVQTVHMHLILLFLIISSLSSLSLSLTHTHTQGWLLVPLINVPNSGLRMESHFCPFLVMLLSLDLPTFPRWKYSW